MTKTPKTSTVQSLGNFIGIDVIPVREADAITLMIHHLSLAAAYFEATPTDIQPALDEIVDTFGENNNYGRIAAERFVTALNTMYEQDELNFNEQA